MARSPFRHEMIHAGVCGGGSESQGAEPCRRFGALPPIRNLGADSEHRLYADGSGFVQAITRASAPVGAPAVLHIQSVGVATSAGLDEYVAAVTVINDSGGRVIVSLVHDFAPLFTALEARGMLTREYAYILDGFYDSTFFSSALGQRQALLAGVLSWAVTSKTSPGEWCARCGAHWCT